MKTNCGKCVAKKQLEDLFAKFMPIKPDTRLVTYNNFMKQKLINYKIVSKMVGAKNARSRKVFIQINKF